MNQYSISHTILNRGFQITKYPSEALKFKSIYPSEIKNGILGNIHKVLRGASLKYFDMAALMSILPDIDRREVWNTYLDVLMLKSNKSLHECNSELAVHAV